MAGKLLLDRGANILLHLGDINSQAVIDALVLNYPGREEQAEVHLVFGNTDYDADLYEGYAKMHGLIVDHPVGTLRLGDKTVVFTHGHLSYVMQQAIAQGATYLCHGHTHKKADCVIDKTRVINPGALSRANPYTVGLLDTVLDKLEFLVVDANNS